MEGTLRGPTIVILKLAITVAEPCSWRVTMPEAARIMKSASFAQRVLLVAGVASLIFIIWKIRTALVLAFGGVVLAVLFSGLASRTAAWTGLSDRWALPIVLIVLASLLASGGFLLEQQVAHQFTQLNERVTAGVQQLPLDLQSLLANVRTLISPATQWAASIAQGIGYFLLVIFVGIYLAAAPATYRAGLLLLLPDTWQARAGEVLDVTRKALWGWLLGTFASMLAVGVLTAAGLFFLGMPAAISLGVIAGLLEFVPIVGPWLAAVPAVLVALAADGWQLAIYVSLFYFAVQQVEGNLIYPLVQQEAASVPPALTLVAILTSGLLFGLLGLFLAMPLLIALLVVVNLLYIENRLGRQRSFPNR